MAVLPVLITLLPKALRIPIAQYILGARWPWAMVSAFFVAGAFALGAAIHGVASPLVALFVAFLSAVSVYGFSHLTSTLRATIYAAVLVISLLSIAYRLRRRTWNETLRGVFLYYNPKTGNYYPFPKLLNEEESLDLTVVFPCIPSCTSEHAYALRELLSFLEERAAFDNRFTYEVIVVQTQGDTSSVPMTFVGKVGVSKMRVLFVPHPVNLTAGLHAGMLHARGAFVLLMDAKISCSNLKEIEVRMSMESKRSSGATSMIIGAPVHSSSNNEQISLKSAIATILFGGEWQHLADLESGFRLITRAGVRKLMEAGLSSWSDAWFLEMLLLSWLSGVRCVWVPINHIQNESRLWITNYCHTLFIAACKLSFWKARFGLDSKNPRY